MHMYRLLSRTLRILFTRFRVLRPYLLAIPQAPLAFHSSFWLRSPATTTPLVARVSSSFHQICSISTPSTPGLSAGLIPEGWSNNRSDLDDASESFPIEDYELPPGKAILVDRDESTYLVECGDHYFLWNDISNDVARVDEPNGLSDILQALNDHIKLKTTKLVIPGAAEASLNSVTRGS